MHFAIERSQIVSHGKLFQIVHVRCKSYGRQPAADLSTIRGDSVENMISNWCRQVTSPLRGSADPFAARCKCVVSSRRCC